MDENEVNLDNTSENSSSGVSFYENYGEVSYVSEKSGIYQWVIKYSGGLVKDEEQAGYVLIGLTGVLILISLFLFFSSGSPEVPVDKVIPPLRELGVTR